MQEDGVCLGPTPKRSVRAGRVLMERKSDGALRADPHPRKIRRVTVAERWVVVVDHLDRTSRSVLAQLSSLC